MSNVITTSNTYQFSQGGISNSGFTAPSGSVTCDVLILQGKNVGERLARIEEMLYIILPDKEKLENCAALKNAYDEYKMLEYMMYGKDK